MDRGAPHTPPGYREQIDTSNLDLWVVDAGIPHEATLNVTATFTGINDNTVVQGGETDAFVFSEFGKTVELTPPPLAPSQ